MKTIAGLVAIAALFVCPARADRQYIRYPAPSEQSIRPPADCARYLDGICRNWRLGGWLPILGGGFEPWRHGKASAVAFNDRFLYGKRPARESDRLSSQGGPSDGTPFSYGTAGPPRGTVVYDYTNAIAFYSQGCCSWRSAVLAARTNAPPIPVVRRALTAVRTERGVVLDQSLQRVQAVYGKAMPQPVPGQPGMLLLSYVHEQDRGCGQFQNFAFLHGRLVYIELLNGC